MASHPLAPTATDAVDVRRAAQGDAQAFARVFEAHGAHVNGLLVRMLGASGEAEEVLQEAFLQAWRLAGKYSAEQGTVRGWLLMLARSRALDRLRSRQSARRRDAAAGHEMETVEPPRAAAEMEGEERSARVRAALATLPDDQRRCIELAFFEGLSHSQIAARLPAPLGTVKSRILMGMRKLRESLASYR